MKDGVPKAEFRINAFLLFGLVLWLVALFLTYSGVNAQKEELPPIVDNSNDTHQKETTLNRTPANFGIQGQLGEKQIEALEPDLKTNLSHRPLR